MRESNNSRTDEHAYQSCSTNMLLAARCYILCLTAKSWYTGNFSNLQSLVFVVPQGGFNSRTFVTKKRTKTLRMDSMQTIGLSCRDLTLCKVGVCLYVTYRSTRYDRGSNICSKNNFNHEQKHVKIEIHNLLHQIISDRLSIFSTKS